MQRSAVRKIEHFRRLSMFLTVDSGRIKNLISDSFREKRIRCREREKRTFVTSRKNSASIEESVKNIDSAGCWHDQWTHVTLHRRFDHGPRVNISRKTSPAASSSSAHPSTRFLSGGDYVYCSAVESDLCSIAHQHQRLGASMPLEWNTKPVSRRNGKWNNFLSQTREVSVERRVLHVTHASGFQSSCRVASSISKCTFKKKKTNLLNNETKQKIKKSTQNWSIKQQENNWIK